MKHRRMVDMSNSGPWHLGIPEINQGAKCQDRYLNALSLGLLFSIPTTLLCFIAEPKGEAITPALGKP